MPARHDAPPADPRAAALTDVVVGRYRPLSGRRRLLIAPLAVVTAVVIVLLLLDPPGSVRRARPPVPDKVICIDGRPPGCVEDRIGVIPVPPPAASAPGGRR
jgi:hypothetical protein